METMETLESFLIYLAKGLVENKDSVNVSIGEPDEEGCVIYKLEVDTPDKGRVIGKQGRIAKAIRVVMKAAANRLGRKIRVEII